MPDALYETTTRRQVIARGGGALLATSALGGLVSACGSSAAGGSGGIGGELSMLIWEGYDSPRASAPFRKKNDVSVHSSLVTSDAEVITKLLAGGASSTSLVTPGNGLIPLMVEADVLDPMDWSKIPNVAKYAPRFAKLGKTTFAVDGQTYAAPYLWGINTLVYNSKYIPKPPPTFMELTKDEYSGKLGIWDNVGNIQTWATVLGYDALNMTAAELGKVTDFIISLKTDHARVFTDDLSILTKALAGGDIVAVAGPCWAYASSLAEQYGSKSVKWTVPEAGCILWTDTWALPKGGPNRETAYAWIDYMIGARANGIVANELAEAPVNQQASANLQNPTSKELYKPEVEERSETFGYPLGTNGTVSYQDWLAAWKRVEAA